MRRQAEDTGLQGALLASCLKLVKVIRNKYFHKVFAKCRVLLQTLVLAGHRWRVSTQGVLGTESKWGGALLPCFLKISYTATDFNWMHWITENARYLIYDWNCVKQIFTRSVLSEIFNNDANKTINIESRFFPFKIYICRRPSVKSGIL